MKTFTISYSAAAKAILIGMMLLLSRPLKAQFVTIPDANFVTYLTTMFPSCMSGNQLDTTCGPITYQYVLSPTSLGISNLDGIQYFDTLVFLDCSNNNLTTIPQLPPTVTSITCDNNALTSLPVLPPNLTFLSCNTNNLTTLPTLPSTLGTLYTYGNSISALPTLPPNLLYINVNDNLLSTLPPLPSSLLQLNISFNNFTNIPGPLPNGLTTFACGSNFSLSSLPSLPASLTFLGCENCNLSSLPTLPAGITSLSCYNNNLSCLPALPNTMYQLYYFNNNSITCMPNYPVVSYFDTDPATLPLCGLSSGCPIGYNITGKLYNDNNLDCSYQMVENLLSLIPVKLYQSGILIGQSYNSSGYYAFNTTALGAYDVKVDTAGLPFDIGCSNPGIDTSITLTALDSIAEDVDFGLICRPGYDIAIHSINRTGGIFFPGQGVQVHVAAGDLAMLYNNTACNTSGISGMVQVTVTGPVTYFSPAGGALTPTVAGNVFTYNIADFSAVNASAFGLIFTTDISATLGDQVCFNVTVGSSGTEYNLGNNTLNHCFNVVNSYDPNIKEVSPMGDLTYPFNDWLTYTVHFQNTGNAPAMNIRVADVLDADLDPSTFRLLGASHNVQTDITGSSVQFRFNNIMLQDSSSNEPASHGFVQYKIKPLSNLAPGTVINNTADIYFDFNSPITTNTTVNTITTTSGIENSNEVNVNIYPNPASEFVIIHFDQASTERYIQLIDMMGRVVQQQQLTDVNNMISLAGIANGIYSIKIVENLKETVKKIVVGK